MPPTEEEQQAVKPPPKKVEVPIEKPVGVAFARQLLTINIHQTDDENGDIARLGKIVAILKNYAGHDEVRLNVINGGGAVPLKMPSLQTGYSAELRQRLVELVGETGLKVEKL